MQVTHILAGGNAVPFEAWATMSTGVVRRLTFSACNQTEAVDVAFALCPGAVAMSVRQADREAPRDALAGLDRRAQDDRGAL